MRNRETQRCYLSFYVASYTLKPTDLPLYRVSRAIYFLECSTRKNNWANMAREVGIDVGFVKQVSFTYGQVHSNFNYLLADLYTAEIYA